MVGPRRPACLIGLLLSGCGGGDYPLHTPGLRLTAEVVSTDGVTSDVWAALHDRRGERVLLPATDEVQVFIPEWLVELVPGQAERDYAALVPAAPEGTLYTVAVIRVGEESAPSSTVILAEAPDLEVPPNISRADGLWVRWTPYARILPLTLKVAGDCIEPIRVEVDDALGEWTFDGGELQGEGSCALTVTAVRRSIGRVDPSFRRGDLKARQVRSAVVESAP